MSKPNLCTFFQSPAYTVLTRKLLPISYCHTDASLRAKGVSVCAPHLCEAGACCPCENGNGNNASRGMKGTVHNWCPQSFRDFWILSPCRHLGLDLPYRNHTPSLTTYYFGPPSPSRLQCGRRSYGCSQGREKAGSLLLSTPRLLPMQSLSLWPTCRLWFQFQPMRCLQAGSLKMVSKHSGPWWSQHGEMEFIWTLQVILMATIVFFGA